MFVSPQSRTGNTRRPGFWLSVGLALVGSCTDWPPDALGQQIQLRVRNAPRNAATASELYGVYLPNDRTMSRGIERARERLADGEYHEALEFLQRVLEQEEDSFVESSAESDDGQGHGLKALAREIIANLPPQGRETYRLLHASAARRQFGAALKAGDSQELTKVVRQYLFTPAGFEAALVLAQIENDRGHPQAAAHLYERLQQDAIAAAQFEPQLSVLTAISWAAAGQPDRVTATLRSLVKRTPSAPIFIAGQEQSLPDAVSSDEELLAWLNRFAGTPRVVGGTNLDWPTLRGNSSRNAVHDGGAPHLRARWQARVVNDPRIESFLASRRRQLQQHGHLAIPAARPIAVGNVVLMRTPQNVVAVDWRTGKRIWETREESEDGWDESLSEFLARDEREEWTNLSHPLEQRMWDDSLTMSLGSDGRLVFVLSGTSPPMPQEVVGWGMNPAFRGAIDTNVASTNRLSAYELATEGKLAWEIDGAHAEDDDLTGTFFLGPPLAVNDALYLLAEVRSAVYLLALDAASGRLLWRQQLAGLEQSISLDPQRRLQGVTPSYDAGILVCPIGSGMVVGVDLVGREFAWVYRYPRRIDTAIQLQQAWQARADNLYVRDDRGWIDGAAVVADGRVFLTPPESAELHCLDLQSGELLWKQQRDQSAFLACVDRGNVLLVGSQAVSALRASDGEPAWPQQSINLPSGAVPTGIGYLSRGEYFLPLSTGQVLPIDVSSGTAGKPTSLPSETALGNFICHRGAVLCQSDLFLDKFEQFDVLRARAEEALARDPRDAAALRDLAEMRRAAGATDEAVQMLETAFSIDPNDLVTRDMLAESLLEALAADFGNYRGKVPLLRQMIDDPDRQIELMRIEAEGLQSSGESIEAFSAYLRLADSVQLEPRPFVISNQQTVRSDCWIRGQLQSLLTDVTSAEQTEMMRRLDVQRQAWADPPTVRQLRSYLDHFGDLPDADRVRLLLARRLVEQGESLATEIALLRLEESSDPAYQAAGLVLRANWLIAANRLNEARHVAATVMERWIDVPLLDGRTGREWLAEWEPHLSDDGAEAAAGDWPGGRVSVAMSPANLAGSRTTRRAQVEFQTGLRLLRVEQNRRSGLGLSQWLITQDGNRLIGRDSMGADLFRYGGGRGRASNRLPGKIDWIQAAQLGDILYATFGGQIVALDSRASGVDRSDRVLWRAYPAGRYPVVPARMPRRGTQNFYHSWSERRRVSNPARTLVGGLGPVSTAGVVLQEQDQLRRVDPLTGETLWSRTDIPPGCELFGDDELLLAADAVASSVHVIRMVDGELVDRHSVPTTSWLLTAGRNVARLTDTRTERGPRKTFRITDTVSDETLFNADYAASVRMATIEPNLIAIVEPPSHLPTAVNLTLAAFLLPLLDNTDEGRFQLVDVATGRLLVDQPLRVTPNLRSIEVLRSGNGLFLMMVGQSRQQPSRYIGLDYPLVNGFVYAFDLATGRPTWPGPAFVEHRGIALTQPEDVPLLMFVDRETTRSSTDQRSQLRLLCLDKRTGATVYRNDALPDTAGGQFSVRAVAGEEPEVQIEMSARTIHLAFSELPRSPEPPANDRVEAARRDSGGGLLGVAERMGQAIQGAIQNPAGTKWNLPASEMNRRRGNRNDGGADDDD